MAFVVAALLMSLGAAAVLLSRKFAPAAHERPTRAVAEPAAVEIASKRARWAIFAVLAATVYRVVLLALEGPEGIKSHLALHRVSAFLVLVAGVLYLRWLYRAVANTTLLRAPMEWAPGQSVAAYFIPIVSFFRPYQVMKALHAGSDPSALHDAPVFRYRPAPSVCGVTCGSPAGRTDTRLGGRSLRTARGSLGCLSLAPEAWSGVGFWERFFDGVPEAVAAFNEQRTKIVAADP